MNNRESLENTLLNELIERLGFVRIFSPEQSKTITMLFKKTYPLTWWGKIDWEKIDNKMNLMYAIHEIIPTLERMLSVPLNDQIYVEWSESSIPVIQANLQELIENFEQFRRVDFEQFIFDPFKKFIIEIKDDGINIGMVEIPETILAEWKNVLINK